MFINMKKLSVTIAGICAVIAFSSCGDMNLDCVSEAQDIIIDASVAEQSVETKTSIDEFGSEKVTYTWLAGDAISVFFGDTDGSIFVTDVTASKAKFKGTIGAVTGGGDDLTDETSLWGVYPYDRNTTCDGSSVTLTLPYEQGAAPDTFADDLFPSIARSTNFTMAFYPVCGSIRFKVSNPDIVKVNLSGNNNEDLAGKATVSMPLGGVPAMSSISEGQKELVMTAPGGGCFETDRYYYFVLYPQTLTKGLTLTYYKEDEKASYLLNSSVKVGRNRFLSATNKDSDLTFTGIQGGEIGGEEGNDEELVIPVSTVTLSSTSLKLYEGDKAVLTAKVMPTDATNPAVTWNSDAPSVAYVDPNGEVTAISKGSATITATADGVSTTCTVTVSPLLVATANYIDEYGVNHGKGVAIGMAIWAPVNCGYKAETKDSEGNVIDNGYPYGKLYQWGRKYGQGYSGPLYEEGLRNREISDATYPSEESGTIKEGGVSLTGGQSVTNKDVFFMGEGRNYDWLYSSDSDELWNFGTVGNPIKTEYDPCPKGWRIPTYSELNELKKNKSSRIINDDGQWGYWFSGPWSYTPNVPQVFLPAAGSRFYDGSANDRGQGGLYWSSTPDNFNAILVFGTLESGSYTYYHACGYSIRCVQE